jgi:hypothetical protein
MTDLLLTDFILLLMTMCHIVITLLIKWLPSNETVVNTDHFCNKTTIYGHVATNWRAVETTELKNFIYKQIYSMFSLSPWVYSPV